MSNKTSVGILFGGKSAEHEVSIQSATNVMAALNQSKYVIVPIYITPEGEWQLLETVDLEQLSTPFAGEPVVLAPVSHGKLRNTTTGSEVTQIDVAFPVLHGTFGEDGTMQGLLKLAGIPFVGADVVGSAAGMDKDVMKRLLRDADIPVAKFLVVRNGDKIRPEHIEATLGLPVFVKPANLGSSVGVTKATTETELTHAIDEAFKYDTKVIIEEAILGREIECSVLGNEAPIASVPGEIIPHHDFYSYEAKYLDENGAGLHIPADLPDSTIKQIQELAVTVFQTLECEGLGRVDFFLENEDNLKVIEINTIPGFTKISMYPQLWAASGIPYPDLIERLIHLAQERHTQDAALQTLRER